MFVPPPALRFHGRRPVQSNELVERDLGSELPQHHLQRRVATTNAIRRRRRLVDRVPVVEGYGTKRTQSYFVGRPGGLSPLKISRFDSMYCLRFPGTSSSGKIAVTGHSGSQAPQSMHSSGWMNSMSAPS